MAAATELKSRSERANQAFGDAPRGSAVDPDFIFHEAARLDVAARARVFRAFALVGVRRGSLVLARASERAPCADGAGDDAERAR
jgi:hypothetical protein